MCQIKLTLNSILNSIIMSYFYSEKMTYCQCMMPREIAWQVVNRLGTQQIVHFQSTNINYENPFTRSLKRCDEALNKISEINEFLNEVHKGFKLLQPKNRKQAFKEFEQQISRRNIHGHLYMNEIQEQILNIHGYLIRQKKEMDSLKKELVDLITSAALLLTISQSQQLRQILRQRQMDDMSSFANNANIFDYKCFIINREDQMQVSKGLFRISRGNIWLEISDIPMEEIQKRFNKPYIFLQTKVVCVIIYQKGDTNYLANKISKFLGCIQSTALEGSPDTWPSEMKKISERLKEVNNLQQLTIQSVERYLHKLHEPRTNSSISNLKYLEIYTEKQRQIYRALSYTTVSNSFLHFNIYIPSKALPLHIQPNQQLPPLILNVKQPPKMPPSKFDSPPIMQIPQEILNTYGVPSYGQFNPAVLYIVTFGFFIGVMFGDVGHMLMAVPLLIIFNANIWFWTVVLWMGYCGLIYNEFFGLNLGIFSSCYNVDEALNTATISTECVYPFGVDSIWKISSNQMQFVNSLKMKLAVVIGVAHMMLGLLIRFINGCRKSDKLDIIALTIPQTIFMLSTFVYMDFLIVYKWNTKYQNTAEAPSVIATMIAAYAGFSSPDDKLFWQEQRAFEKLLAGLAFGMIPIMLLAKPIAIYCFRKGKKGNPRKFEPEMMMQQDKMNDAVESDDKIQSNVGLTAVNNNSSKKVNQNEHQQSMRQVFVHQFIETIEFVLGSVSNTASYLRLWALSLAHGQLAQVIFDLTIKGSVVGGYSSLIGLFFVFPFFYAITFGVLICMDSMECFLHSLRLHWVQFQNKFYQGRGYQFLPFTFNSKNKKQ